MNPDARCFHQEGMSDAIVGNYDAAEFYLLKSLEIEPSVPGYATLGWLYSCVQRRDRDALRCFRNAIRLNPENGDLYNDFGAVLLRQGELQKSVKWFLRALKSSEGSKHHLALFNLAIVYRRWNRSERSRRYLNLALKLRPDFERARSLLAEIRAETQTVN